MRAERMRLGETTHREDQLHMFIYATSTIGWVLLTIAFLVVWIALAFWPARVARRKGHSFIGYFIFSLFFFPLALLTAYLVHDRR
jgi:hypothetical protein